ncbi:DNA polymerase IV [Companilactobacillus sp. RD055328]|uniref:DNA polymerase IV n=1 Tax=Companilactobacillus sp. RD055328 TaxID=2916634 RepID=UPI00208D1049|nr:DNA polymerase IV [Companilactobacillus sp. RD055328]GKQ42104.1 DNA polymerase IV [Companilactobacillus sp. RD055328]
MALIEIPLVVDASRKILHVDMDAFYASVEEREHPEYKKKALVIAHDPRKHNNHGVVTTANYNARKYGVNSAMPSQKALELIPKEELLFTDPNFTLYRQVSDQIHDIFKDVTDKYQTVALDEAYLDITENKLHEPSALKVMQYIQTRIFKETNLTCSIGVSYNKFLAKMGSEHAKPFGRSLILPEFSVEFLADIPIEKFNGIGKNMQSKLHDLGIYTGRDLQAIDQDIMINDFGKWGFIMFQRCRGIDNSEVEANQIRKSVGKEQTYNKPLMTKEEVYKQLNLLSQQVFEILSNNNLQGKTVVIKARTTDFQTVSKRKTLNNYLSSQLEIYNTAQELFDELDIELELRLVGVTVTTLDEFGFEELPLKLFED